MQTFLPTHPHHITRDPQQRRGGRDGRVVVGVALGLGRVGDGGEVAGHEVPADDVVGAVFVGEEVAGEEAGRFGG